MNLNITTYCIYLPIIVFITVRVGWLFYTNGEVFLFNLLSHNTDMVKPINKLLLTGYYLTNIGYTIITISYWEQIETVIQLINSLTETIGKIILMLAILHYNNIFWLKQINKSKLIKN